MINTKKAKICITINIICMCFMVLYYVILNTGNNKVENFIQYTEIASLVLVFLGILLFEIAYRKDSNTIWIYGIEVILLSISILLMSHIMEQFEITMEKYTLCVSGIYIAYYIIKNIFVITHERKKYLNSLSDIKEIIKKEKPIKKEAKRKTNK